MTSISIREFGGIAPIRDRSKLSPPHGQVAENCLFEGGNLRAQRAPVALAIDYAFQSSVVRSIFRLSDLQWLRWYGDVAATRGPTPIDENYLGLGDDFRIYYAGDTGDSPTWPRWTTRFRAMGNSDPGNFFDAPAVSYPVGVPPPQSVPTAAVGAAPSIVFTVMRKGNPVQCESLTPHNFANGNRAIMTGMPATGDGSELADNQYAVSVVDATTFKMDSADGSEWAGDVFGGFTATRVYADSELEDRIYVYTFVNEFGEEGAPSGPSTMAAVGDGQSVTIGMDTNPSVTIGSGPTFTVTKKRIYRSVAGETELQYLFVAEVPISTASYVDSLDFAELGEVLVTENYDLPPQGLKGLILHPNGFLLGFVGNRLYASEPYLPYAWPADYINVLEHDIVSLEIYGATVVVLTNSKPYLVPCTDPQSIAPRRADQVYPCVHRQAAVSTGMSVVYVSPVGLISFDHSGARNLTADYYNKTQWKTLIGNAIDSPVVLEFQDQKVWMLTESAGLFCFDQRSPQRMDISTHPIVGTTMSNGPEKSDLFVMYGNPAVESTRRLYRFNGDSGAFSTYTWRSPRFILPKEVSFSRLQTFARQYSGPGGILGFNVHWRTPVLDGDAEVADSTYGTFITSKTPMVLPGADRSGEWEIEVIGNVDLQALHLVESIDELREIAL